MVYIVCIIPPVVKGCNFFSDGSVAECAFEMFFLLFRDRILE